MNQPKTPLPWGPEIDAMIAKLDSAVLKSEYRKANEEIAGFVQGQRDYIVHAANAYPKLIEAIKSGIATLDQLARLHRVPVNNQGLREMRAILNELGEPE